MFTWDDVVEELPVWVGVAAGVAGKLGAAGERAAAGARWGGLGE